MSNEAAEMEAQEKYSTMMLAVDAIRAYQEKNSDFIWQRKENFLSEYRQGRRDFAGEDLRGLCLEYSGIPQFENLVLDDANVSGSQFTRVKFINLSAKNALFTDVEMIEIIAEGADFSGTNLDNIDGHEARLGGSNFFGASLIYASLRKSSLWECNFTDADCTYAQLNEASLRRADLWKACFLAAGLTEAKLQEAKLYDADFRLANISAAKFEKAVPNSQTIWTGSRNSPESLPEGMTAEAFSQLQNPSVKKAAPKRKLGLWW
ncbi:MAG: pentapeptide repeat-containing protein [Alphaproteobacteria bacterium]